MRSLAVALSLAGLVAIACPAEAAKAIDQVRAAPHALKALALGARLPLVRKLLMDGKKITIAVRTPSEDKVVAAQFTSGWEHRWADAGVRRTLGFELLAGRVAIVERSQTLRLNGRPPSNYVMVEDLLPHAVPFGSPILRKDLTVGSWEFQWTPETARTLRITGNDDVDFHDRDLMRRWLTHFGSLNSADVADAIEKASGR